jgi:hypothetical protein
MRRRDLMIDVAVAVVVALLLLLLTAGVAIAGLVALLLLVLCGLSLGVGALRRRLGRRRAPLGRRSRVVQPPALRATSRRGRFRPR